MPALILLALLVFLPSQALGLSLSDGILLFNVPSTDRSMIYLGQLFGDVGNVLRGPPGLLSHLFPLLNGALLAFVGAIASYVLVKSVLKTAMEGKILGEQANYWVVGRTIGGLLALVPKFSGYSFIQVVVMWAVVQSVGLADSTWNAALDFFDSGGSFYDTGAASADPATPAQKQLLLMEALNDSATMLNSAVCMYLLQKNTRALQPSVTSSYFDPFTAKIGSITFGTADKVDACGSYTLQNVTPTTTAIIKDAAVTQVATRLMPLALHISNKLRVDNQQAVIPCVNCAEAGVLLSAAVEYAEAIKTAWPGVDPPSLAAARRGGWIAAASHYDDLIQNSGHAPATAGWLSQPPSAYGFHLTSHFSGFTFTDPNTANTIPNWANLKDLQAALGGNSINQYFYNVSGYYSQAADMVNAVLNTNSANQSMGPGRISLSDIAPEIRSLLEGYSRQVLQHEMENSLITSGLAATPNLFFGNWVPKTWRKPVTAFDVIEQDVKTMITSALNAWKDSIVPANITGSPYINPIARSKHLGMQLITAALTFMENVTQHTFNMLVVASVTMTATLMAASYLLSRVGLTHGITGRNLAVTLNVAMQMGFQIMASHVFWYLPLGAAIAAPMLTVGASLAGYIPLLPFIVFTFAVIGWLTAVLEAMVAAPLVAFGMTHPEGHDVLGRTEQGMMLLLSLFIRPICMLIGLLIGLALVYFGTELLDVGYLDLTLQLIADATKRLSALPGVDPAFTVLIIAMILLTLYTFILMAVVSQCMTAVYVLPDKIMRWIGLPPESSGIAAMVEQTKSGTESKMGEGAHAGAGMGGDMRHAGIQPAATQMKGKDIAGGSAGPR